MKLALVTGGCHRVGAAISAKLAEEGWTLALHARHNASPDPALLTRLGQCGAAWHGFVADLAYEAEIETLVGRVTAHFGQAPHLLVNNASLFGQDDPSSLTLGALVDHFTVNTAAPVLLARSVAALATSARRAVIINILDQRIRNPVGDQASYTISKLALAGATEMLARALAPAARVCAVAPGLTMPTEDYLPAQLARLEQAMPLGLLPEPEDIADAVAYLAAAESVTGQVLFVDGGAHLTAFERDFVYLGKDAG
ncbi:SDR family oxidoreductase [Sphingobium boeckii]|uniref:NAD(P)-dependent dehydrogenase (Short-subunit alcohol dehydrogenase family) n=1 Tax=Sphingobium boeckii TaxID=1082345 RepID=A0A7W9EFH7_9SPHN|nr:SDR family oxidoreductase [Sphingobium boeckii]MBB5686045.1 NAD(P)-dependent dehydrogenase (short-subunit alcohol dehydrogenase family) [Sphingobium boeckii]